MQSMFKTKRLKEESSKLLEVSISIPENALNAIFDECDQYDKDETGGRVIGAYRKHKNALAIEVMGIIGPGPNASRSSVSFFQDGEYQTGIFRQLEQHHPNLEHLGNWHTHHVNGLSHLSNGDIETYTKIVNHQKHNTDFFYAILVTRKHDTAIGLERYSIKHYLLQRGEQEVFEVPESSITITRKPILWPVSKRNSDPHDSTQDGADTRAKDKEYLAELYPNIRPYFSKKLSSMYWKGEISLVNNKSVELVILETTDERGILYSIGLSGPVVEQFETNEQFQEKEFESAHKALCIFERELNREVFNRERKSR
jgi:hypothetical protein